MGTAYKTKIDAQMAELEKQAAELTGKENKKMRSEKEKERMSMKNGKEYIDACKVVKGSPPVHGHFIKSQTGGGVVAGTTAAPAAEAEADTKDKDKKDKPKKAQDSAGISRAEKDELESLKNKIIEKKTALKAEGMSGGQINKHEEIVAWVARMNEEKESPGSTAAGKDGKKDDKKKKKLDSATQALLETKQKAFEEYTEKLRTEFKYSKKEIAADPEYQELKAEIDKLSK